MKTETVVRTIFGVACSMNVAAWLAWENPISWPFLFLVCVQWGMCELLMADDRRANDQAHLSAPGGRAERNQKEQ